MLMSIFSDLYNAKKIYYGINNKAKRVKKVYIGNINGVANLIKSILYKLRYRETLALTDKRIYCGSGHLDNYAIFAGGYYQYYANSKWNQVYLSSVEAYNKSLTKTLPSSLNNARQELASGSNNNNVLFAGGYAYINNTNTLYSTVDRYNGSLTHSTVTALSSQRYGLTGANVGNYIVFAGGRNTNASPNYVNTVEAYNTSFTKTIATSLRDTKSQISSASINNYAIFAGGYGYTTSYSCMNTVDAYDTSLTKYILADLIVNKYQMGSANIEEKYALFAGGNNSATAGMRREIEIYNRSLVKSNYLQLSSVKQSLTGASLGNYAIFAGGQYDLNDGKGTIYPAIVDYVNKYLTITNDVALSAGRSLGGFESVGNYAIYAGGSANNSYYNTVDVFELYED